MAPLYTLFCVTKPTALPVELFHLMKRVGTRVYGDGGVVTQVASYGNNDLAYPIKRAGETFNEGEMWQMGFHSSPGLVKDLRKLLSEDHRVLRQLVTKEPRYPPLYYFSAQAIDEFVTAQKTQEDLEQEAILLEKERERRTSSENNPETYFDSRAVIDDTTASEIGASASTSRQRYGGGKFGARRERYEPEEIKGMADLEEEVTLDQIAADLRKYDLLRLGLEELLGDETLTPEERSELEEEKRKVLSFIEVASDKVRDYQDELRVLQKEWAEELDAYAKREEEVREMLKSEDYSEEERKALEQMQSDLKKRGAEIEENFLNIEAYSQFCLDIARGRLSQDDVKKLENYRETEDSDSSDSSDSDSDSN